MVKITEITLGDFVTAGISTTSVKSARETITKLNMRSKPNETKTDFLFAY